MADFGFGVSALETDIFDPNINDEDILYSSKYSSPKVYAEGTGSVTIADGESVSDEWSFNHNLGVPLAFFIYYKAYVEDIDEDAYLLSPNNIESIMGGLQAQTASGLYTADYSDENGIHFKAQRSPSDLNGDLEIPFKYYVLLEPLISFNGTIPPSGEDFGFKITKAGYNYGTAKEHQLSLSSSYKFFKLLAVERESSDLPYLVGTYIPGIACMPNSDTNTYSFSHNLGYYPAFWAYTEALSPTGTLNHYMDTPWSYDFMGPSDQYPTLIHVESFTTDTKFYYRVRRISGCDSSATPVAWPATTINFIYAVTYEKLE